MSKMGIGQRGEGEAGALKVAGDVAVYAQEVGF